jgi:hypothetical protein
MQVEPVTYGVWLYTLCHCVLKFARVCLDDESCF